MLAGDADQPFPVGRTLSVATEGMQLGQQQQQRSPWAPLPLLFTFQGCSGGVGSVRQIPAQTRSSMSVLQIHPHGAPQERPGRGFSAALHQPLLQSEQGCAGEGMG